jgi:hypothetical protein
MTAYKHFCVLLFLCASLPGFAQTPGSTTVVPRLVAFSGLVTATNGKPLTGTVAVTFSLYAEQQGGSPLWSEIQTVQPDATGHYSVFLGSASPAGLPLELFTTGVARWLAVRPDVPAAEDPARILLVGVPYALKAADADTLGGKPASAFLTAPTSVSAAPSQTTATTLLAPTLTPNASPTGSGITNYLPLWSSATNLGNSAIYQSGNNIGIGTIAPGYPFTVSTASGTVAAPSYSYLANFFASASGNPSGNSDYRGFNAEAKGTGTQSFTALTGFSTDANNALTSGTIAQEAIAAGNVYVSGAGSTTAGYGFRATPVLSSTGGMGAWQAFEARSPSVTGKGVISTAYGLYMQPQKVAGVTSAFGIYQGGSSDANYLAGPLGIGTATPSASLEVNGPAKFDGPVTFAGPETATGNVTTNGALISTVPNGTAPLQVSSSTQVANLNASFLSGQPAGAFPLLAANNFFGGSNTFGNGLIASTGNAPALEGQTANLNGPGVYGVLGGVSLLGQQQQYIPAAVWGDTNSYGGAAVFGSSDQGYGGYFETNSSNNFQAFVALNFGGGTIASFSGIGGACDIDAFANLFCAGSKSAVVPVDNATRKVALYAVESPENWFEDFGSGRLSAGSATVNLDPVFAQTVNVGVEYHVFLTPKGDSQGHLYVTNETATGFEVHESAGGQSNIAFDYRIVARRKGYESIRLADKTKEFDRLKLSQLAPANGRKPAAAALP